jgi:hypothetical protein
MKSNRFRSFDASRVSCASTRVDGADGRLGLLVDGLASRRRETDG